MGLAPTEGTLLATTRTRRADASARGTPPTSSRILVGGASSGASVPGGLRRLGRPGPTLGAGAGAPRAVRRGCPATCSRPGTCPSSTWAEPRPADASAATVSLLAALATREAAPAEYQRCAHQAARGSPDCGSSPSSSAGEHSGSVQQLRAARSAPPCSRACR